MLEIYLCIISFIIGAFLGSFCTLAVYRIPLHKDITHERSFCINCNHKLGFWDLIPIFSYIFLRGKCRYCGQKIRIRYFLLEIFFGFTYMIFIISLNINITKLDQNMIIYILYSTLYLVMLFIIAGIDKEYKKIQYSVLVFGAFSTIIYMLYLYVVGDNIYRYGIYILTTVILILIGYKYNKQNSEHNYKIQILLLLFLMLLYSNIQILTLTIISTYFIILLIKIKNKTSKEEKIPIGFLLCSFNIFYIIIANLLLFRS